jgi:hypothetical protein
MDLYLDHFHHQVEMESILVVVDIIQGYITLRITSRKLCMTETQSKMYGMGMLDHSQKIS